MVGRRALVIPLVLGAFGTARAAPCAALLGDATVVAAVQRTLDARGAAEPPSCQPVTVRVARSAAGIVVAIEDAYGRTSERVVADPNAAATVVESWTRIDEVSALLAVTPPAAPVVVALATPRRDDDELPTILHHDASPPSLPAGGAALAFESSFGSEHSQWLGARGTACLTFGASCIGVLVRAFSDVNNPTISHYGVDLLVGADVTWRVGPVRIVPGAAIGLGWIHSEQIAPEMFGFPQPDFDAGGLRTDVHVGVVLPLGRALSLELVTSFDFSVRADQQSYPSDVATLVAEPRAYLRTGLGLRYGAP